MTEEKLRNSGNQSAMMSLQHARHNFSYFSVSKTAKRNGFTGIVVPRYSFRSKRLWKLKDGSALVIQILNVAEEDHGQRAKTTTINVYYAQWVASLGRSWTIFKTLRIIQTNDLICRYIHPEVGLEWVSSIVV